MGGRDAHLLRSHRRRGASEDRGAVGVRPAAWLRRAGCRWRCPRAGQAVVRHQHRGRVRRRSWPWWVGRSPVSPQPATRSSPVTPPPSCRGRANIGPRCTRAWPVDPAAPRLPQLRPDRAALLRARRCLRHRLARCAHAPMVALRCCTRRIRDRDLVDLPADRWWLRTRCSPIDPGDGQHAGAAHPRETVRVAGGWRRQHDGGDGAPAAVSPKGDWR